MKKLLIIPLIILFFLTLGTRVHANILDKNYQRIYTVNDDYVQISETKVLKVVEPGYYIQSGSIEGFIIFNPIQNDPEANSKLQKTLTSISLVDGTGRSIKYMTESTSDGNLNIKISLPQTLYFQQSYTINLTYKSYGIIVKSGALRDVYIPAFAKNYIFENSQSKENVSTTVIIPKSFGPINFISPQINIGQDNSNWIVNYKQDQLIGNTAWIEIGDTQYYSFKITQEYNNSTTLPFATNTYKLIIPNTIQRGPINQSVIYTNISPKPDSVIEDSTGNLFAIFKIPANQSGKINIEGYGKLTQNNNLDLTNSGKISDVPSQIESDNTKSAQYWESENPEIIAAAKLIAGSDYQNPNADIYNLLSKTYKFVIDKINYDTVKQFGINARQGAVLTLEKGAGVCMEYSDLFIALMRSEGVPARAAFGTGYSGLDSNTFAKNAINHQWAEVYIPKLNSWIEVDTTWGKNGPALIGGDLNHFYSHVASTNPDTPTTTEITYFGNNYKQFLREMSVHVASQVSLNGLSSSQLLIQYKQINNSDDILTRSGIFITNFNLELNKQFSILKISPEIGKFIKLILLFSPLIILTIIIKIHSNRKRINKNK